MSKTLRIIIVVLVVVVLPIALLIFLNFASNTDTGEETEKEIIKEQVDDKTHASINDPKDESWSRNKDSESNLFILVNKERPLPRDYEPDDLVELSYFVENRSPEGRKMRREAASAFDEMVRAALRDNIEILATTAYRSYDFQRRLYDNYVKKYGEKKADTFSAKPGFSEHQTGLAVDVSSKSVNYELITEYGNTNEGKWLKENCHKFGFIIRYEEGKEDITGYMFEPWHLRYVGEKAAAEIVEAGTTLEEYVSNANLI